MGYRTHKIISFNAITALHTHIIYIGSKRDENGEWRRFHNEELLSLYRSPNIFRVIKSRRLKWAGHISRMEESRNAFKILKGKPT